MQSLDRGIAALEDRANMLLEMLDSILDEEDPLSVSFKLPPTSDFVEFRKNVEDLVDAFEIPISRLFGPGSIKFSNFDRGSDWVVFVVPAVVLDFIRRMLRLCNGVMEEQRQREEAYQVRDDLRRLVGSHLDAVNDARKKLIAENLREACEELTKRSNPNLDDGTRRETVTFLISSIEKLNGMFEKGSEAQLALTAPKPRPEEQALGLDSIKALVRGGESLVKLLGPAPIESPLESGDPADDTPSDDPSSEEET